MAERSYAMIKQRYSRISDLFELLIKIKKNHLGITYSDIINEFHVSRRTAERMMNIIKQVEPRIQELYIWEDANHKHFGFI